MRSYSILGKILAACMPAFFLMGCSGSSHSPEKSDSVTRKPATPVIVMKKPPSSFDDTIFIKSNSAVFYHPDSLQLDRIKAVTESRAFETEVHNCFFLMRNAHNVLKKYWPGIHVIEISKARWLVFVKTDKSTSVIDLDSEGDMCGAFLFDRKKDPLLIDMMNIDTALRDYFK